MKKRAEGSFIPKALLSRHTLKSLQLSTAGPAVFFFIIMGRNPDQAELLLLWTVLIQQVWRIV